MESPRTRPSRRPRRLPPALWAGLTVCGLLPSMGCQVEYAGMTLPSGKYMHDDVQYFPPGPDFPWANTQAATQRARMQAMGLPVEEPIDPTAPVGAPPRPEGALDPTQIRMGRPAAISASPLSGEPPLPRVDAPPPGPGLPPARPGVVPPPPGDPEGMNIQDLIP